MTRKSSSSFYLALSVLCGSVMALQILQSRLFSVVTWYHLSFLVISIAMFGLTLGALKVYRGNEQEQRDNLNRLAGESCFMFSISMLFALIVQLLVPIVHTNAMSIIVTLPLVAGATACCYYYAGQVVTLCLTRSDRPIGLVYGADLFGASLGCLAALFLMEKIDTPTAIILLAGIAMLCGALFHRGNSTNFKSGVAIALFILAGLNLAADKPMIYPFWTKSRLFTEDQINYEKWNAISRVTVQDDVKSKPVFIWGASPNLPENTAAEYQYLTIDGDAGTPLTKFDGHSWNKLKYLEYDVTNLAYFLPGLKSAAIIGVGGGRDLLSARYFGVDKTLALDVNSTQVGLLTEHPFYKNYTNLASQPGTRIINSEARSWLSRSQERFDIIQMSMIDTWASTGAGAFALSENSLYTTEAFKIFLHNLNPHGILTVSRWYTDQSYNDIGRLIAMASATLIDMGVKEPWKHIYVAQSGQISTLILGRDEFTPAQTAALDAAIRKFSYRVLASPGRTPENPVMAKIYKASSRSEIMDAIQGLPFDLSPPTDMRPFFFNQAHVGRPLEVLSQTLSMSVQASGARGHAIATMNLYLIILFSAGMAAILLIPPLKGVRHTLQGNFLLAGSAYFMLIGLGFMFIEITLMQIMSMFLGHPIYGLGIVLFSLILSTGIGSTVSEFFPVKSRAGILVWIALTVAYVMLLSLNIESLLNDFVQADLIVRALICVGLILPCGILLGYAFPTGIRLVQATSSRLTTWFWAINGAAGVVASALAILISIGWGLDKTLMLAALLYALLAIPALSLLKQSRIQP